MTFQVSEWGQLLVTSSQGESKPYWSNTLFQQVLLYTLLLCFVYRKSSSSVPDYCRSTRALQLVHFL